MSQSHDGWDLALLLLATIAAIGAVVVIWGWIIQQRKRPEVQFIWYRPDGNVWEPNDNSVVMELGIDLVVEVVVKNIGTGSANGAIMNILAPGWAAIVATDIRDGRSLSNYKSGDPVVDNPPDNAVTWVTRRVREFYPTLPVMTTVGFSIRDTGSLDADHTYYLAASLDAAEFSATGHNRWPSWAHRVPIDHWWTPRIRKLTSSRHWPSWLHWGAEDFWGQPDWPGRKYRRWFRMVRALPKGVRAGPGKRMDRRPIRVEWPPAGPQRND